MTTDQLPREGRMPSLDGATGWLNSPPLASADLRGRVVLVDFWTYTCINWLRTEPYVRAWAQKYRERGLVVLGVHTPEFSFEHDADNVRRAVADRGIDYPVAMDNDYAVWDAFANRYWPALYFVDAQGTLRHHHFGEGRYEQSERVIQRLLAAAGADGVEDGLVEVRGSGAEAPADWDRLRSPETYLGALRAASFASPGGAVVDAPRVYAARATLRADHWALSGAWTVGAEAALLREAGGTIAHRFQARDLHLVMGPASRGASVPFHVRLDGRPPGADHGLDVDAEGDGALTDQRLYQLVRQRGPVGERTFEITFAAPGVEAYVFTFG